MDTVPIWITNESVMDRGLLSKGLDNLKKINSGNPLGAAGSCVESRSNREFRHDTVLSSNDNSRQQLEIHS